jgi:hypothetical protein
MWIVWYTAAIGSLSALSLLPIIAPKKIEVERQDGMSSVLPGRKYRGGTPAHPARRHRGGTLPPRSTGT